MTIIVTQAATIGCKSEPPASTPTRTATTPTAAKAATTSAATTLPEPEPKPARAELAPPLVAPLELKALQAKLAENTLGTLRGEIFGDTAVLRGVVRTGCGNGTILQFVAQPKPEAPLVITPPVRLPFFGLPAGREISFDDGPFTLTLNLSRATPTMSGSLRITYLEAGKTKVYLEATMNEATPLGALVAPQLSSVDSSIKGRKAKARADAELPTYPECLVSGHFSARDSQGRVITRGLLAAHNLKGQGIAMAQMILADQDTIRLMVVPPKPNAPIEGFEFELGAVRQPQAGRPAVAIDLFHAPEIAPPAEASGRNVGVMERAMLLEGSGRVTLTRPAKDKPLKLEATFQNLAFPPTIQGAMRELKIFELRIEAHLLEPGAKQGRLLEAPAWYSAAPDPKAFRGER